MFYLAIVGMALLSYAIVVANLKILIFSHSYTKVRLCLILCLLTIKASILIIFLSIASFFLFYFILSLFTVIFDVSKTFLDLIWNVHYWGMLAVVIIGTVFIDLAVWRWTCFSE